MRFAVDNEFPGIASFYGASGIPVWKTGMVQ
jgi:hypothetical protein